MIELDEYTRARLIEAHERAVVRTASPWLNRADAAEHCRCSPSEIDRAAEGGIFKRYVRSATPLFRREEFDAAIAEGSWLRTREKLGERKERGEYERDAA